MNPINLLNEAKTRRMFLEADRKELDAFEAIINAGDWKVEMNERFNELLDLIDSHIKWFETHAQEMSEAAHSLMRAIA